MEKQSSEKRFALLIDADNVSSKYIKPITDELSKYGTVTYKRIYGDWTLTLHAKWKDALLENSITPIQQFGYTQGKNATDSAMIIDAMDILYTRSVEGFCIVSSDSDFTRLASRIRESGLTVIGMGEKKTPVPFRKACDIFTTLELLLPASNGGGKGSGRGKGKPEQGSHASAGQNNTGPTIDQIEQAVVNIITDNQNNGKSTGLGEVGSRLLKRYPDFDVRSYGTNLLSKLLDEFQSVQITKDGSSVTVELTEDAKAPEHAGAEAADATADEKPADKQEKQGEKGEKQADKPGEGSRGRRTPRNRANRRAGDAPANAAPSEAKEAAAPEPESAPAVESAPEPTSDRAAAPEAPEPVADFRPGRSLRKRAAASHAKTQPAPVASEPAAAREEQPAAGGEGEPAAQPKKPARRKVAPAAAEPQDAAAPESASAAPQDGAAAVAPAPASDPEAFIRQLVAEAGADGIALSELGKRVRGKFRSFKVRDLGFSQLRQYVASLDGLAVEKRADEFFAQSAR